MKTFKLLLTCCTLFFFTSSFAHAQDRRTVDAMVKHWESSKALTLAVAEAMPADDYSFKATPEEMSFGEQITHIAKANANYCSRAIGSPSPLSTEKDDSKAAAEKTVTAAYDFCIGGLKQMTDADLMKMVGKAPNQTTAFEAFWGGFTHAAHHRGQTEVYLRLKGIKPPSYTF